LLFALLVNFNNQI